MALISQLAQREKYSSHVLCALVGTFLCLGTLTLGFGPMHFLFSELHPVERYCPKFS
jgi:hypothetical protein